MTAEPPEPLPRSLFSRIFLGRRKDLRDPGIFHRMALIPFLAWVGLGADGLSSSSYGPDEAYRALGEHTYLAVGLALATALTVFIISLRLQPRSSSTSPTAAAATWWPPSCSASASASSPAARCWSTTS